MTAAAISIEKKGKVCWFVMRAYKSEKQAEEKLKEEKIEYFIPKCYAVRVYHGVKSKRLVPAIPSMVFVHASQSGIADFKKRYNFLQFVMWKKSGGLEYLTVPDGQMENFIKVASHYEEDMTYLKPEEVDLKKGTRVRILGGDFNGVTGVFMRVKGKRCRRLVVMLDGIMAIAADIRPDLIEVLS